MTNAEVTHCPYGHEYTPENTRITRAGTRQCCACSRRRRREQYRKRKARGYYDPARATDPIVPLCVTCGLRLPYAGRGQPPKWCDDCRPANRRR